MKRIIVINFDKSWNFASLVRQHCLDLYRTGQQVEIWNAIDDEEEADRHDEKREFWGDWPRWFGSSRVMLQSEIFGEISKASSVDMLVFIWIFPPLENAWPAGVPLDFEMVERIAERVKELSDAASRSGRPLPQLWRLAFFRNFDKVQPAQIATASDWVTQGLLNNVVYPGSRELAVDHEHDMWVVRSLIDLARDETAQKLLRAGPGLGSFPIFECSASPEPVVDQVSSTRQLIISVVDKFEEEQKQRREQRNAGDEESAGSLEAQCNDILEKIDELSLFDTPAPRSSHEDLHRALDIMPRLAKHEYKISVVKAFEAFKSDISRQLAEDTDDIRKRKTRGYMGRKKREEEIVEKISRLSDGLVGSSGADRNQIQELRDVLKERIKADTLNAESSRFWPGQYETPGISRRNGERPQRLNTNDLQELLGRGWRQFEHLITYLAPPWALISSAAFGLVAMLLLVLSYMEGAGFFQNAGTFDQLAKLLAVLQGAGYPTMVVAFGFSFLIALYSAVRATRAPLKDAAANIKALSQSLETASAERHNRFLNYDSTTYTLGLLRLLDRKLEETLDTLSKLEPFKKEIDELVHFGEEVPPESEVQKAFSALRTTMEKKSRNHWIGEFLTIWPFDSRAEQISVHLNNSITGKEEAIFVESRYFSDSSDIILTPVGGKVED